MRLLVALVALVAWPHWFLRAARHQIQRNPKKTVTEVDHPITCHNPFWAARGCMHSNVGFFSTLTKDLAGFPQKLTDWKWALHPAFQVFDSTTISEWLWDNPRCLGVALQTRENVLQEDIRRLPNRIVTYGNKWAVISLEKSAHAFSVVSQTSGPRASLDDAILLYHLQGPRSWSKHHGAVHLMVDFCKMQSLDTTKMCRLSSAQATPSDAPGSDLSPRYIYLATSSEPQTSHLQYR